MPKRFPAARKSRGGPSTGSLADDEVMAQILLESKRTGKCHFTIAFNGSPGHGKKGARGELSGKNLASLAITLPSPGVPPPSFLPSDSALAAPRISSRPAQHPVPAPTAAAASQRVAAPTFARGDPTSPYATLGDLTFEATCNSLYMMGQDAFAALFWQPGTVLLPGPPRDPDAAAVLQAQVDQLLARGQWLQAQPWQAQLALYCYEELGVNAPETLRAFYALVCITYQLGHTTNFLYSYLLPRAARRWGLDHPDTRQVVVQAAHYLCESEKPSVHPLLTQMVTNVATHLVGGLGWGNTVVAPVPDDSAFNKHAFAQYKGECMIQQGQYQLAKDILQRCVAFYDTLGLHWLGTARKARCMQLIGACVGELEGAEAALPLVRESKRFAQQELGAEHRVTLQGTWQYAEVLLAMGRTEQALSLFGKTLMLRKSTLGARHLIVYDTQVGMARALIRAGKYTEAQDTLAALFEDAIETLGNNSAVVKQALAVHWDLLHTRLGRPDEAEGLKERAAALGCDVSVCVEGAREAKAPVAMRHEVMDFEEHITESDDEDEWEEI